MTGRVDLAHAAPYLHLDFDHLGLGNGQNFASVTEPRIKTTTTTKVPSYFNRLPA